MCRTPWCFGDCDECMADKKAEQAYEESTRQCPHREECKLITVDVKTDKCKTCHQVFKY